MPQSESVEYKDFRITVSKDDDGYVASIERVDRRLISAGYGFSDGALTHRYKDADSALAAAKLAIDNGDVK